ncbi:MAG TPA: ABC transporter substrate-binding protein [Desulfovibrio sp.]|jgi:phospholipid transport system substrate-binding protein|uniref:MlaC/ttg2D family ABC transporter substrate-binding protein n=1 Tax=Desulfovibrio TaxID=872 RepID=UPI002A436FD9|nr:ABC transporter substrate-binding protein [Desulfovibrio sp.]MDY0306016.1 ABC transporter substrate-binding protein [Desulfovibrionaceae bacterium]HMM39844.1 ABC transporter substrate-binding protein [Desulfovibrio sp.]
MKRTILSFAAGIALFGLLTATAWAGVPTDTVKEGVDKVISILQDPKYKGAKAISGEQLDRLRAAIRQFFDFDELTARAVGRPWLKFTPQQQKDLSASFQELLEKTYISKFEGYNGEKFDYQKEMAQGNLAFVQSQVQANDGKLLAVNFRLIQKDGHWLIYDVIGEGISIMEIYRSQFAQELQNGTPDSLIGKVRDRVADIAAGRAPADDKAVLNDAAKQSATAKQ